MSQYEKEKLIQQSLSLLNDISSELHSRSSYSTKCKRVGETIARIANRESVWTSPITACARCADDVKTNVLSAQNIVITHIDIYPPSTEMSHPHYYIVPKTTLPDALSAFIVLFSHSIGEDLWELLGTKKQDDRWLDFFWQQLSVCHPQFINIKELEDKMDWGVEVAIEILMQSSFDMARYGVFENGSPIAFNDKSYRPDIDSQILNAFSLTDDMYQFQCFYETPSEYVLFER